MTLLQIQTDIDVLKQRLEMYEIDGNPPTNDAVKCRKLWSECETMIRNHVEEKAFKTYQKRLERLASSNKWRL